MRFTKVFAAAQKLAEIEFETFLPGVVNDTGIMSVRIVSPIFEYEDPTGSRKIFLEMLENCDEVEFTAGKDDNIVMTVSVKEEL